RFARQLALLHPRCPDMPFRPVRRRLAVEFLESRITPTVHIWTDATGNVLWSDPGNWIGGAPPSNETLPTGNVGQLPSNVPSFATFQDIPDRVVDEIDFQSDGYVTTLVDSLGLSSRLPTQVVQEGGTDFIDSASGAALAIPTQANLEVDGNFLEVNGDV